MFCERLQFLIPVLNAGKRKDNMSINITNRVEDESAVDKIVGEADPSAGPSSVNTVGYRKSSKKSK